MNTDMIKGKWRQIKGDLQKTWGKITDDEWETTKGDTNAVTGLVQNKYGEGKEDIKTKITDLYRRHVEGNTDTVETTKQDTSYINKLDRNKSSSQGSPTEF